MIAGSCLQVIEKTTERHEFWNDIPVEGVIEETLSTR
jgi:hypothetical protein